MAIKIREDNLNSGLLQSGFGTPTHLAPKGTLFTDKNTANIYINKNGTNLWTDISSSGGTGGSVNPTSTYIPYNDSGIFLDSFLNQSGTLLKTTNSGNDIGLNLDFNNNQYYLGDYNDLSGGTHIWIDNNSKIFNMYAGEGTTASTSMFINANNQSVKFVSGGTNEIGVGLDFANNIYWLGDYYSRVHGSALIFGSEGNIETQMTLDGNTQGLQFYNFPIYGMRFYAIGDLGNYDNGSKLLIDDWNNVTKTGYDGVDVGLILDYSNRQYLLGDFGHGTGNTTNILIDDGNQKITISGQTKFSSSLTATTIVSTYIDNNYLRDNTGTVAIDTTNRQLKASNGSSTRFDWENMTFNSLTNNGFLKVSGGNGSIYVDTTNYLNYTGGSVNSLTSNTIIVTAITANTVALSGLSNQSSDNFLVTVSSNGTVNKLGGDVANRIPFFNSSSAVTTFSGFTFASNTTLNIPNYVSINGGRAQLQSTGTGGLEVYVGNGSTGGLMDTSKAIRFSNDNRTLLNIIAEGTSANATALSTFASSVKIDTTSTNLLKTYWGTTGVALSVVGRPYTDSSSVGSNNDLTYVSFGAPTFSASTATAYSSLSTVYIDNAPTLASNVTGSSYALKVNSGNVLFNGSTKIVGSLTATTISATTYVNLPGSSSSNCLPTLYASSISGCSPVTILTPINLTYGLNLTGATNLSSTTINGTLTITGGTESIFLTNPTQQQIKFFSGGTGVPQLSTYSPGAKIILYDNIDSSISTGFAIGVDTGILWYGADLTGDGHEWYAGTRKLSRLVSSDGYQLLGLGGPTSVAMTISGTSALGSKGGLGYMDFLRVYNNYPSATNPNKWFRTTSGGTLQILNSAYTSVAFDLTDSGILSVGGGNIATTSNSDGVTNYLSFGNNNTQIYDDGNTHIHSRSAGQTMWINTNGGQLNLLTQSPLLGGGIGSGIAIATGTLNGYVTINTGRTVTTAASYGYLTTGGAGTYPGGSQSVSISLYATSRIWGQEIDAFSDERMKDIQGNITLDEGLKLVNNLNPIKYTWKKGDDKGLKVGYSAQQVVKSGFNHLISIIPNEGLEETIDDDGFVSPKDTQFSMNYDQVVPYHGVVIKHLLEKINELEKEIKELKAK